MIPHEPIAYLAAVALAACTAAHDHPAPKPAAAARPHLEYEHPETKALVALVDGAAKLVETEGEAAFPKLRAPNSRWRHQDTYVFVLDPDGIMRVHPDPALEGKNQLDLEDVNGRPIIRGLLQAATEPGKPEGWYHYEWPVPGGLLPRWKSSYVRLVTTPSGKRFVVGSGMYDERMERAFVVDMVTNAVAELERHGPAAFPELHDRRGPFIAKDAYVFVIDPSGRDLVHPAFPNLEGKNLLGVRDTQGKPLVRDMLAVVETRGSGWVDYMWPKPGEGVSTQKSTYVSKARVGGKWLLVGAGVYLADAPKAPPGPNKPTAPELMQLVRDGAALFERRGDEAYRAFRTKGSRWFRDDTYFFLWTLDGTRVFHAADPAIEHQDASGARDIQGRPYGRMFLDVVASPSGEGWVHYLYPEPGNLFPVWKSAFIKRVRAPNGVDHLIGSGIYNMKMDRAFIKDVVDRAAALVAERGPAAFAELRDRTGPFVFMDTYVFVETPEGTELVNPGQPSLEGKNLIDVRDAKGTPMVRDYIAAALKHGDAWTEYDWYRPGSNRSARKITYVRTVHAGADTYIVGSGFYLDE